jgi:hypothetical protein
MFLISRESRPCRLGSAGHGQLIETRKCLRSQAYAHIRAETRDLTERGLYRRFAAFSRHWPIT